MIDTERDDSRAPWTPPGLRLPRVGDRVRVLPRPECEYCREEGPSEEGRLGVVDEVGHGRSALLALDQTPEFLAHPYWVLLDPGDVFHDLSHYAAIELEILADDDGG